MIIREKVLLQFMIQGYDSDLLLLGHQGGNNLKQLIHYIHFKK